MTRPCAYDVGAGRVQEGDDALALRPANVTGGWEQCHVDTIYHDGDVQVTFLDGSHQTLKWRFVVPNPVMNV